MTRPLRRDGKHASVTNTGTGDWATDERPKSWREGILYLYPNGETPLTGMLSKMGEESVDDPQFHWWTKLLAAQGGTITDVYTDAAMTTALAAGGTAAGTTLYVKAPQALVTEFRSGHQVLLRDSAHINVDVNGKVTSVTLAGANSQIAVRLLEADDNGGTFNLATANSILIVGNINAEGAPMPDAIAYNPDKWFNYTQIFRTPLDITRTARKTKLRTEDAYKEAKRESLELHSIELEKAFFWGIATENVGANGKPERTTMGIVTAIKTGAPINVSDFSLDTRFAADTWVTSGEEWLDIMLEQIFRYGATEKMAFCGSGAIMGINKLAKERGHINITPQTVSYGLKVMEWITPFGVLYLMRHPLFSYEPTTRNSMVIVEMSMLKYRYIDDTMFMGMDTTKVSPSHERLDGTKEEWLTECGLEYHHPLKFGYLNGVGLNNTLP